jgi:uncharacterized protein YeaO (DUF488 family)
VHLPHRPAAFARPFEDGALARRHAIGVKRASERPLPGDGMRVLVERRWPPGQSKERIAADLWLKDAAPSDALVRACATNPARWDEFKAKYRSELEARDDVLRLIDELRRRSPVTLLHAGGDRARNTAVALREILDQRSGPRPRRRSGEPS